MTAQLDLFDDSRAVVLANQAIDAALAGLWDEAGKIVATMQREVPDAGAIAPLRELVTASLAWPDTDAAASARNGLAHLDRVLEPAARAALGERAHLVVDPRLRELLSICERARLGASAFAMDADTTGVAATTSSRVPAFDAAQPGLHPAALHLRLRDWAAAERSAMAIADALTLPDPLAWLTLARHRLRDLAAARPTLFALAWRAPARLGAVLDALADTTLDRDWRQFQRDADWDLPDEEIPAWFPAWYLVEHPAASSDAGLAWADRGPSRAAQLLRELHAQERNADVRKLPPLRARLREVNQGLFDFYMRQRTRQLR